MSTVMQLIRKLRNPENKIVLQAVAELRARGWLEDGSLKGIPLCYAHLQNADLFKANLTKVDLHQANLESADLSLANLQDAKLARAKMCNANFDEAFLQGADFFKANLHGAHNLNERQLTQVKRLWGAIMPDGASYDGRYNLSGDLEFARWGKIDIADQEAMADFLGVPLEVYLRGQERTRLVVEETSELFIDLSEEML
ncbi:MAG: pentapeptide repeat-containing protein [Anaerolineales bacterium]